jgi:hypothetical protein
VALSEFNASTINDVRVDLGSSEFAGELASESRTEADVRLAFADSGRKNSRNKVPST